MRRRFKRHAIRNLAFARFLKQAVAACEWPYVGPIAGLFARRDAPYVEKCRNANRPAIDPCQAVRRAIRGVVRKYEHGAGVIRGARRTPRIAIFAVCE